MVPWADPNPHQMAYQMAQHFSTAYGCDQQTDHGTSVATGCIFALGHAMWHNYNNMHPDLPVIRKLLHSCMLGSSQIVYIDKKCGDHAQTTSMLHRLRKQENVTYINNRI